MFRLLLVLVIAAISKLAAADLSGKWTGTMETNGSRVRIFVTLNLFQPSTGGQAIPPIVAGSVATGDESKPVQIEKGKIQGDTVSFEVHDNAGRIVKFRLSLTGLLLVGEAEAEVKSPRCPYPIQQGSRSALVREILMDRALAPGKVRAVASTGWAAGLAHRY